MYFEYFRRAVSELTFMFELYSTPTAAAVALKRDAWNRLPTQPVATKCPGHFGTGTVSLRKCLAYTSEPVPKCP